METIKTFVLPKKDKFQSSLIDRSVAALCVAFGAKRYVFRIDHFTHCIDEKNKYYLIAFINIKIVSYLLTDHFSSAPIKGEN